MPKVSVVMTAYNAMAYLPQTMETLLWQSFTDFELVLVNNGSTDNIVEWVTQLSEPRIKLISQENRGIPGGLNRGIAHAQGEYITFLDADDLWDPTKLEKQVKILDENPEVGLVYNWVTLIDEHSKDIGGLIHRHSIVKFKAEGDVRKQLLEQDIIGCGSSAMVRRVCFEEVGVFDPSFTIAADWDMWVRIGLHYPFKVIKEPLTYYRKHSRSMTSNWQAAMRDCGVAIEKIFSYVSPELQYLKNHSYGRLYFYHAQQRVRSLERDYCEASRLYKKAVSYYPRLAYCWSSMRLNLTINLLKLLGAHRYDRLIKLLRLLVSHTKKKLMRITVLLSGNEKALTNEIVK
ncbi:glycosyltransferase [Chlorogloeopsis sp. ULAP01]|uniref:glycosyltransferase family 2 protein n=1 Tax=Chlorogloeopsis sp. ULAP01 TaxID=3056483 RepID=UPI0025AAAA54|nr:glycosyltransferase [Chlorogloeopsis sp. ULAP01]MDM9379595.1 glycosyltransferase [Chlorogloeopsis sp. ULAP01]